MSSFERVLDIYLDSLLSEGGRLVKIKTLSFGLEILTGFRRVTLSYFYAFIACVLFTASLFSIIVYNMNNYNTSGLVEWDVFNAVVLATGGISLFFLFWSLNEKRWLRSFNINQKILNLSMHQTTPLHDVAKSMVDEDKLAQLIEFALDKKLNKLVDEKIRSEQATDQGNREDETQVYGHA